MKLLKNIEKKISKIQGFFLGKKQFKNKEIAWDYLHQIQLSTEEGMILKKSFRTRIKIENNREILQFRISPEDLNEIEIGFIPQISDSIQQKLQQFYDNSNIEIQIKISNCCNSNCYNCSRYTPI